MNTKKVITKRFAPITNKTGVPKLNKSVKAAKGVIKTKPGRGFTKPRSTYL